jgi:protocatechuate 3,4-dioxygenase beta subunit
MIETVIMAMEARWTQMTPDPISEQIVSLLEGGSVTCRQWAEQDLGPYYLADQPVRRDITEDRPGVPLGLGLLLAEGDGSPVSDGAVAIWHCDAVGRYSGFPPPTRPASAPSETPARPGYVHDRSFLRGRQATNAVGMVEFRTIYPGWYPGRTVHIHLMVSSADRALTSQLYFPDPLTDTVHARPPYSQRPGRDTTNHTDVIFPKGGEPAVLQLHTTHDGYLGAVRLHLPTRV